MQVRILSIFSLMGLVVTAQSKHSLGEFEIHCFKLNCGYEHIEKPFYVKLRVLVKMIVGCMCEEFSCYV